MFVIYRASVCRYNTGIASTSCWNADYNVSRTRETTLVIINRAPSFILLFSLFQLSVIKLKVHENVCRVVCKFLKF